MVGKILNYGSVNIDESFSVPHICLTGETLSSTNYFVRAGGKGRLHARQNLTSLLLIVIDRC